MILECFSVFDEKAKAFLPPFFLPQRAMAVRTFGDCVNDRKHAFGMHPEDYTLWFVGKFDCGSGQFHCDPVGAAECVVSGLQLTVLAPSVHE